MARDRTAAVTSAQAIIAALDLAPHPEGGWFRETFRDKAAAGERGHSTAIYYLLEAGQRSHWHRVDAAEVWHYYAGAALELGLAAPGDGVTRRRLGPDVLAGERPQAVVPAGHWQSAVSLGEWTLVGSTVAPGFDFSGFEMAAADWSP